jgi:hypothetical protein
MGIDQQLRDMARQKPWSKQGKADEWLHCGNHGVSDL